MSNKRFLAPILVLAVFGLPAGASTVAYCDGYGCGGGTLTLFDTLTSGDTYASASALTFSGSLGLLAGNEYTDDLTSMTFQATNNLSISNGVLDTQLGAGNTLLITVPATYTFVVLTLSLQSGSEGYNIDSAGDYANLSSTPTTVGYINASPTGPWTIQISPFAGSYAVAVNSFDAGPAGSVGNSDTPEVGTMLLIGSGLISMRWLKRVPRRLFHHHPQAV